MSERGSFVTQYFYCERCFAVAKDVLLAKEKYLCSCVIPSWGGGVDELPIIAGKIGGLYSNEEVISFEEELGPQIAEKMVCPDHAINIVVMPDNGTPVLFSITMKKDDKWVKRIDDWIFKALDG